MPLSSCCFPPRICEWQHFTWGRAGMSPLRHTMILKYLGSNAKLLMQAKYFPKIHGSLFRVKGGDQDYITAQGWPFRLWHAGLCCQKHDTWLLGVLRKACNRCEMKGHSVVQSHLFLHAENQGCKLICSYQGEKPLSFNRASFYLVMHRIAQSWSCIGL